jgi:predicted ATPase
MELVYLWVEKYKNIEKQGFNFSPRFECKFYDEYDEDGKLKDDCKLVICDKKQNEVLDEKAQKCKPCKDNNYIENFFGDNVNITAIVGENGSGKSSVQKLIFMLIYYIKFKNIQERDNDEIYNAIKNIEYALKYVFKTKLFFIIKNHEEIKIITFDCKIVRCNYKNLLLEDEINSYFLSFDYTLGSWYQEFYDSWVNTIYHKNDTYSTPLLIQPDKQDKVTFGRKVDIDKLDEINKQNILKFYNEISGFQTITNFFKPNYIKINEISHSVGYSKRSEFVEFKKVRKIANQIDKLIHKFKLKIDFNEANNFLKDLKSLEDNNEFEYLNQLYIAFKILLSNKAYFNEEIYKRLEQAFRKMLEENKLVSQEVLVKLDEYDSLIKKEVLDDYRVDKINKCINFQQKAIFEREEFVKFYSGEKLSLFNTEVKEVLLFLPPWLQFEFYEDDKSLNTLSNGEKILFTIVSNIMYQVNNIFQDKKYNSINIFLDEVELGLHPNWQKRYLSDIIKSLKSIKQKKKQIYLCFASHSPFFLSDIPKENIIFLEKYKENDNDVKNGEQKVGNCKNVTKEVDIQTFGANIHTLLSHGFFMKDGLMGEFAKGKIENIRKFYNKVILYKDDVKYKTKYKCLYEKKQKEFWHIQKIIGEPFLQTIVKNQLEEIETILFQDKAQDIQIQRYIEEFGADKIREVLDGKA